jgi:hypothetical protein
LTASLCDPWDQEKRAGQACPYRARAHPGQLQRVNVPVEQLVPTRKLDIQRRAWLQ